MAEEFDPLDRLIVRNGKAVLPDGAKVSGKNVVYNGKLYDATTGVRVGTVESGADEKVRDDAAKRIDAVQKDPLGTLIPTINPLSMFGISTEDFHSIITRGGIILLGASITIIGVAMLISGTKTADLAKSLIPVAGKVL